MAKYGERWKFGYPKIFRKEDENIFMLYLVIGKY